MNYLISGRGFLGWRESLDEAKRFALWQCSIGTGVGIEAIVQEMPSARLVYRVRMNGSQPEEWSATEREAA
ncbi:hypothetical protein EPN42_05580 [bacterium]|nr:MAG: hypothetical protein EPN42_05580 [bacterium]